MPTNQELQATITKLEKENERLKKGLLDGTILSNRSDGTIRPNQTTSTTFEDRVWEAVLIGAVSTLFDPTRIAIDNRPKALDYYLARALRIADSAVVAARAHKEFNEKEAQKSNDPLQALSRGENTLQDLLPPDPLKELEDN